ncbi:MAG TPA: hypothetical protein VN688_11470 [Gemmataceae bacterium]|nr:hypothetical protein [Gemmataceae bacterium]
MRSIPSSVLRRAVILGTLALMLSSIQGQAASEYKLSLRITDASTDRQTLRYGGRDFDAWCIELRTELKPAVRIEGLKALSAFGANGYAKEATAAICKLMRGYDVRSENKDDTLIVATALDAIKKIGAESLPELKTALKNDKRNIRRFAVKALLSLEKETQTAIVLDVVAALGDADWYVNYRCLDLLQGIEKTPEIRKGIKAHVRQIVPALVNVLKATDRRNEDCQFQAIVLLGMCGPDGKNAVPALIKTLNETAEGRRLGEIVFTLGEIGPTAKDALPVLKARFGEYLNLRPSSEKTAKPGWFSWSKPATFEPGDPIMTVGNTTVRIINPNERPLPQTVKDAVKKIEGK